MFNFVVAILTWVVVGTLFDLYYLIKRRFKK